jgi:Domain of unknown function (DUF1844)
LELDEIMTDTTKFEVIDRRKYKADEERDSSPVVPAEPESAPAEPQAGPRLVTTDNANEVTDSDSSVAAGVEDEGQMPPPPTVEESRQQESAYEASAQRLEDLVRAQNPAMGAQPPVGFEHLVQQLYLSAMMQMGAAAPEGQRPRVDILGAKQSIDLLGVLAEKTKGNLSQAEDRTLQTVLFEARMAFNELTNMISMQGMQPPPAKPDKR